MPSSIRTLRALTPRAAIAVGVAVVITLLAVGAPVVTAAIGVDPYTYHPETLGPDSAPAGAFGGISADHWFGVEPLSGRDLFAIVVYGARTSLLVGVASAVLTMVAVLVIGLTAGYFGGWIDRLVSAIINVLFGFPALLFMIALGAVVPPDASRLALVIAVMTVFGWAGGARVIRSQTMTLRERDFVRYARATGASTWHILTREVLPNLRGTAIVFLTLYVPAFIGTEAALSFLGVGVPAPTPSWGRSIGDSINWVQTDPWYLLFPGAALVLITLAINEIGETLRQRLSTPTLRSVA
ncbi:ABC transporter permease [Nocardia camponoti]|uniref:Peptide ABC transporter permease n=1 Tax=Nocardia camponoti TaxID=1616106 RepID=A0A917QS55_9NOCA|nr:ABC transporter permease [Nocardia camponoti]GGK65033.1 peptide ABC transporter permease [Nocardia camponoti]